MIKPYFPPELDAQADWYENFNTAFDPIHARLGFTDPEADAVSADCAAAVFVLRPIRALASDFEKTITGYVRAQLHGPLGTAMPAHPSMPVWPATVPAAVLQGIDDRRQAWVQRVKGSTGYNSASDGAALRIEPTGDPFNPTTYQAVIRAAICTGPAEVRLKLAKANGAIDANKVRMRRTGQTAWLDLGNFTKAEVFDRTPMLTPGQPEQREYQTQAVIQDALFGIPSDIETVLVRA